MKGERKGRYRRVLRCAALSLRLADVSPFPILRTRAAQGGRTARAFLHFWSTGRATSKTSVILCVISGIRERQPQLGPRVRLRGQSSDKGSGSRREEVTGCDGSAPSGRCPPRSRTGRGAIMCAAAIRSMSCQLLASRVYDMTDRLAERTSVSQSAEARTSQGGRHFILSERPPPGFERPPRESW